MSIHLVAPSETRVVVGRLPGWPISPAALFERLNARITREQLLRIAAADPFGAHRHFPILARVRVSGRVPARLEFDPGEALRLTRWGPTGPDTDHLARAWCCALLVIYSDTVTEVGAQLVESCLALGDDAPELAEQLLAWRAISEQPDTAARRLDGQGRSDPVALLALLLLRMSADPTDVRLPGLARTIADAFTTSDEPRGLAGSVSATHWADLVDTILTPLRPTNADLDRLAAALRA